MIINLAFDFANLWSVQGDHSSCAHESKKINRNFSTVKWNNIQEKVRFITISINYGD